MLSFSLHTHRRAARPIVARMGHIVIHHRCRSGWLAGLAEPALDAATTLAYRPVGDNAGSAVRTAMASSSRNLARKSMTDLLVGRGKPSLAAHV
jgi:hypothetical protein